ncbi:MAG: preprotein translocase subunit SecA [Bacteroidetes bacterium GWF2_49_14]|nr:MAG: preprotein translocase subunit SecA [Bacteroidetes bacterium GWF2_49_14]
MSLLNSIISGFFGNKSKEDYKSALPAVEKIKAFGAELAGLTHDELRARTREIRLAISSGIESEDAAIREIKAKIDADEIPMEEREQAFHQVDKLEQKIKETVEEKLNEYLPLAFAIVKETATRFMNNEEIEVTAETLDRDIAARRDGVEIRGDKAIWKNHWLAGGNEVVWDMIHYDVQLIGGLSLHQGKIAEMATGEGKTLVATLPVFLNALSGRGVHVVTVNDYLAKRDSEWMGPMFEFHGLRVDCIDRHQPNSEARRNAYMADITYGTNNEFGFDYLRDNMAISPDDLVQRGHNYAIVDEVDSVLIDDARTPLIISGPVPKGDDQLFGEMKPRVVKLVNAQKAVFNDTFSQAKKLIAEESDQEGGKLLLRAHKGLPKTKSLIKFLSEEGMKALMHKTENFYMQENSKNMHVVTDDLFFVIDEKNNSVELTEKGIDLITGAGEDPEFFVLPDIGVEIAEIERTAKDENEKLQRKDTLIREFSIKSERVHTINQLLKAYTLFENDVEYVLMEGKVKIVDEQTGRIMEGRRYSDGLHQAIEAKENVKVEAATQTFATITLQNYFRMYNKLSGMTGTAETEAGEFWSIYKLEVVVTPTNRNIVRDDREDLVYKTKREKYNAVIDEIVKLVKEGRACLVGTTSVEISELLSRMLKIRGIAHNVLNAKLHQREAEIVLHAGQPGAVTIATNMAGRGTDIKLHPSVKTAGGLAIIGTERHESRRVDRQLRGRAGRQGDPGSSQFFVSLEDDLMRLFGSDRIAKMMDRLGLKEGEVIQHSMITKSIERAQRKVEENNFGIRKRLLEYDDVMNSQREVVYGRRRHALYGERIEMDIMNMMGDLSATIVEEQKASGDFEEFRLDLIRYLAIDSPFTEDEFHNGKSDELSHDLSDRLVKSFNAKNQYMAQQAWPVIKDVYERAAHQYENIMVPITDGQKTIHISTNLKKAYETQNRELVKAFSKSVILATIDEAWKEHLREMDDLKQSVQNATYEQKDPLLIYKLESFDLFKNMVDKVNREVISMLMKGQIPISQPEQVREAQARQKLDMSRYQTSKTDMPSYSPGSVAGPGSEPPMPQQPKHIQPIRVEKKVGRNDPCPCGSGKKYKQCHGRAELTPHA